MCTLSSENDLEHKLYLITNILPPLNDVNKPAPCLSKLVFIDFDVEHTGDTFFPDDESRKG